ncbi:hypothetical protein, partial [Phragmitibacter flavus]|uniref:hypothetical protein n=1 Tax=Phragmitibacter flavus TaxID=2576071 RepID=UPI00197E09B0
MTRTARKIAFNDFIKLHKRYRSLKFDWILHIKELSPLNTTLSSVEELAAPRDALVFGREEILTYSPFRASLLVTFFKSF